jgi:hypothetical protein
MSENSWSWTMPTRSAPPIYALSCFPNPEIGKLLREYVDIRVEGMRPEKLHSVRARSEALHHLLWSQMIAFGQKHPISNVGELFIQSLNEMINLHAKRVVAARQNRIPGTIWIVLYVLTGFAMSLLGYHAALAGGAQDNPHCASFACVLGGHLPDCGARPAVGRSGASEPRGHARCQGDHLARSLAKLNTRW